MLTRARNQKQGLLAVVFTISALLFTGCEKKQVQSFQDGLVRAGEELFSNRPEKNENFKAIIKLKNPALFSTAGLNNGHAVIDSELLQAIVEEQKQFLEQLAQVAPNTKVIFKYRMILNGFSVEGPTADLAKLQGIVEVSNIETDGGFDRPKDVTEQDVKTLNQALKEHNSVKFIGAENLRTRKVANEKGVEVPLDGTGMKIGIIDTGIDYTHSMLGGAGSAEIYKSIDPTQATPYFPNKKVVGGKDFVGTEYNAASADFRKHIPRPDANPLDEAGHGSHVAGTIAGWGDGVETYSGVAPGADLYALKVFGADGSTSDSVVIAALEYAADPSGDGDPADQLDVVNMSLGGPFGSGKILYTEAIQNLSRGGTVVVASAGNEGDVDAIVGSPSVADAAISVAAGIDDMLHNWQFDTVRFSTPSFGEINAELVEAVITKTIAEAGDVHGELVYAGLAAADFSDELKAQLNGKVAFIDRGQVTFVEKIRRAQEAGAIGVVVANNDPSAPFVMGGDDAKFDIPAVMISQELGTKLKGELPKGGVVMHFKNDAKIEKPQLIDTITDFSSRGPRSQDSMIKPEITAPGKDIVSAAMGEGRKPVRMSGTSMSGPHITGAMALLKQAHRNLNSDELKALLLNRAKTIKDEEGVIYSVSRQGAGRVQIDASVDAKLMMQPAALSLGEVNVETRKTLRKNLTLRNMTKEALTVNLRLVLRGEGLSLKKAPAAVTLAAGEQKVLPLNLVVDATKMTELVREMDGWIIAEENGQEISRVPVLAMSRKVSNLAASNLVVESGSAVDAAGSAASLTLTNSGKNAGEVLLFNLLSTDQRKADLAAGVASSRDCDLQTVGYRLVNKVRDGKMVKFLQVAAKVYRPTQWRTCEVDVLIDSDGNQVPEQELAGIMMDNVAGLGQNAATQYTMASGLFDGPALRELRRAVEAKALKGEEYVEDYTQAVTDLLPMTPYDHSTVMVIEAEASNLMIRPTGELAIKVVAQDYSGSSLESDDFAGSGDWTKISLEEADQSYSGLPEKTVVNPGETTVVEFEKGMGEADLMVLMPQNLTVFSDVLEDRQQALLKPNFVEPAPSVVPAE